MKIRRTAAVTLTAAALALRPSAAFGYGAADYSNTGTASTTTPTVGQPFTITVQGPANIPVIITVYQDRSFTFILKTPPAAILIKKAAGLHTEKKKGSGAKKPGKEKVGQITRKQLEEIAKKKIQDTTAASLEACMNTIAGTARSMGIDVVG